MLPKSTRPSQYRMCTGGLLHIIQKIKKMKTKYSIGLATLGVVAILATSCGEIPQEEMNQANAAISEARAAGAELYAPEAFVALQDSMNAVSEGIEAQSSKFFSNYSDSKEGLAAVTQLAGEVQLKAESKKEELKTQIQATIAEVKGLIEANNQLILDAPRGKEGTSALVAIQGELTTIETAISETGVLLEQGEYFASLDKATAAKEKATAINTELQTVISKYQATAKAKRG